MKKVLTIFNLSRKKLVYFVILFLEKSILISTHIYFINFLNRDLYGLYNQINFLSGFIVNFSLLGTLIPIVLNAKKDNTFSYDNLINTLQLFFLPIILIVFLIAYLFKENFSEFVFGDNGYQSYVYITFFVVVADLFSEIYNQKKRILDELIVYSKFILFRTFVRLIILFFVFEYTQSFLIAISVSTLSYYLILTNKIKLNFNKAIAYLFDNRDKVLRIFKNGFWFLIIYLLTTVNLFIINVSIASQLKLESLAIYNFNFTLATFPLTFITYIIFYSLPGYTDSKNLKQSSSRKLLSDILLSLTILSFSFGLIYGFYDLILNLISKDNLYSNINLFSLVFFSNFLLSLNGFFQFPLLKNEKFWLIALIQFIGVSYSICHLKLVASFNIMTPIYVVLISNVIIFFLYIFSILFYEKSYNFFKK